MKIVLVTGTRSELSQNEKNCIEDAVFSERPDLIIHGDCPTGVDFWTNVLCELHEWFQIPMPARWDFYDNSLCLERRQAGPDRNYDMCKVVAMLVAYGHEAVCLAFPRGIEWSGTRNCMSSAEKWGIPVKEFVL